MNDFDIAIITQELVRNTRKERSPIYKTLW